MATIEGLTHVLKDELKSYNKALSLCTDTELIAYYEGRIDAINGIIELIE